MIKKTKKKKKKVKKKEKHPKNKNKIKNYAFQVFMNQYVIGAVTRAVISFLLVDLLTEIIMRINIDYELTLFRVAYFFIMVTVPLPNYAKKKGRRN